MVIDIIKIAKASILSLNQENTAYAAYSEIATFMWVSLIKRDGLPSRYKEQILFCGFLCLPRWRAKT